MQVLELPTDRSLVVLSYAKPFATVVLSDFGGRRSRERLVLRGEAVPPWLRPFVPHVPRDETIVVAARGRANPGGTIRVRSVIVYPAHCDMPEHACVYVEEWDSGARPSSPAAPFHVIRCAELPELVRFVEVPRGARPRPIGRHLRPV